MNLAEETFYRLEFEDETIAADGRPSEYMALIKKYLDREIETDEFVHFEYNNQEFQAITWHGDELVRCYVRIPQKEIVILIRS